MEIIKVINNNTIIAVNDKSNKVILTGKGIGFGVKKGDLVDSDKISQKFVLDSNGAFERYTELIQDISESIFPIVEEIIYFARTYLRRSFSDNIYLTLSDHLHFAIERSKKGEILKNALHLETKNFYPDEYEIGRHSLKIIEKRLSITLPEDEMSFVALHFVNAELNENMAQTYEMTNFLHDIQNIVKYHFGITFDENSLNYYRFVTHLKFFAQRILNKNQFVEDEDDPLVNVVMQDMSFYYEGVKKIENYVKSNYGLDISKQESIYLTIHLRRVLTS